MKQWWTFLAILALIIIGGIWYESSRSSSMTMVQTEASTTASIIIPGVQSLHYTNSRLAFSISYPAVASSSEADYQGFLPLTQTSVASFMLPKPMFAGTNLVEAGVYVGATTTPSVMQTCESRQAQSAERSVGTTTIGGQDFATFTAFDAGAGNLYESKIFRTYQNGACFEIVELLHSGNIGNYTPGTVTAFDHDKFSGILDAIAKTYMPIPTGI